MKRALPTILAAMIATTALAQIKTPRPSPKQSVTQTVGVTDITITYSRPGVKGRAIWGALVPYDKVWRTGANEATTMSFGDDVTVNGQPLKKGMYSLHTIPNANEWTIIFNSVADQWGSYSYDESKDTLRIKAKPEASPEFHEWLAFEFPELTTDVAKVAIRWEKISVPFTVNTDTTARTLAAYKNALKPDWRTPLQAASFAFDTKAASDAEINAWLDQSLKIAENTNNLWLKARMQQRAGNIDEAKKTRS